MAAAEFAEGTVTEPPPELSLALACKGWDCLPGEYLAQPAGLMKRLNMSLNIYQSIQGRNQSKNWAEWAKSHPDEMAIIDYVERLRRTHG